MYTDSYCLIIGLMCNLIFLCVQLIAHLEPHDKLDTTDPAISNRLRTRSRGLEITKLMLNFIIFSMTSSLLGRTHIWFFQVIFRQSNIS